MHEELTAGQVFDWQQFHRQFNLAFDKIDHLMAIGLADFRNANRGDGPETKAIEMLPWVDPYGDDEAFLAGIRAIAETVKGESGNPDEV